MTLSKNLRGVPAVLSVVMMTACAAFSPSAPTSSASKITTYQSIWINADWSGGRTGSPLETKTVGPGAFTGSYCPANSLILENHSARY